MAFKGEKIIATIGGTHLLDSDWYSEFETEAELSGLAQTVSVDYPGMSLITGHCTGLQAQQIFSEILSGRFELFHSGSNYEFEDNKKG